MSGGAKREIEVVGAAIVGDDGRVLIVRRNPGDTGGGRWEFPGGKIDPGETAEQALVREIREELSLEIGALHDLGKVRHEYDDTIIHLRVYRAKVLGGSIRLVDHDALEWLFPKDLDPRRLIEADRPFVQRLIDG